MRFIKLENNSPIEYTLEQLFKDHPGAVIYKNSQMPNEQLLSNYNVYPLITTDPPKEDVVTESVPTLVGYEWYQTWISRPFTEEERVEKQKELDEEAAQWFVNSEVGKERYNICQSCDNFIKLTTQCTECNCIMLLKTKLQSSKCPIDKW